MKKVHVVFKTHLDIGYTDLAQNVIRKYVDDYIPKAIETARLMDEHAKGDKFIWTTGSWLIRYYLKNADANRAQELRDAIKKGYVKWHGLPFTTHTELMDVELFNHGLSYSKELDQLFGTRTISAKMTDVPGHTKAMIPYLAKAGIRYLHIGINACCKQPSVPDLFLWKGIDGSEVIVHFSGNYGDVWIEDKFEDALIFAHTGDNEGPSSIESIQAQFDKIRSRHRDRMVEASTLDQFAENIWKKKDSLPVITQEIGDSWIYGIASDPQKISRYRELLRLKNGWTARGEWTDQEEKFTFMDAMIMVPEHTWGGDVKKFLCDFVNYSKQAFRKARAQNLVPEYRVPATLEFLGRMGNEEFDMHHENAENKAEMRSYQFLEATWNEQRNYLVQAIDALDERKKAEALSVISKLAPDLALDLENTEELNTHEAYRLGKFNVTFGNDGSIVSLVEESGKSWVNSDKGIGAYRYEIFGHEENNRFHKEYSSDYIETYPWVDFGKPAMDLALPQPSHQLYSPWARRLSLKRGTEMDQVWVELVMPSESSDVWGAPRRLAIRYAFQRQQKVIDIELHAWNKDALRLPEAGWLSFSLTTDNPNLWKIEKMGEMISPLEIVKNGSRNLHAVDRGIFYQGIDGSLAIESLDAPLVSVGGPQLWKFDNSFNLNDTFYFNLHNNLFGTNFSQWVEGDMQYRFRISLA